MNKPKRKGTAAESAVVAYLNQNGFRYAERLALQGGKDRGDITGIPGIVVEVKAEQQYALSGWLSELEVEIENAKADHGFVAAKPRMVGVTRTGDWYAITTAVGFEQILRAVCTEAGEWLGKLWIQDMPGHAINRDLARYMKLAHENANLGGCTHSCVRITPKSVKDPNMHYVVTTLRQMSDLLVRAGYGRRDV
jgi:hypothetical protein